VPFWARKSGQVPSLPISLYRYLPIGHGSQTQTGKRAALELFKGPQSSLNMGNGSEGRIPIYNYKNL